MVKVVQSAVNPVLKSRVLSEFGAAMLRGGGAVGTAFLAFCAGTVVLVRGDAQMVGRR